MKTSLSYLPEAKRDELKKIVYTLLDLAKVRYKSPEPWEK
jgi:hypothetical protein